MYPDTPIRCIRFNQTIINSTCITLTSKQLTFIRFTGLAESYHRLLRESPCHMVDLQLYCILGREEITDVGTFSFR